MFRVTTPPDHVENVYQLIMFAQHDESPATCSAWVICVVALCSVNSAGPDPCAAVLMPQYQYNNLLQLICSV